LAPSREAENGLLPLLSIAPTLLEAGNSSDYERFRSDVIARHGMVTDPLARLNLVQVCLLLTADKDLLASLQPHADVLKTLLANKANSNYQSGFAAMSLAMMSWRSGDFAGALEWSSRCRACPTRNLSRDATAHALAAMAEQRLGHSDQARADLEKARAILAGPYDSDAYYPRGKENGHWFNWSIARLLDREATALMGINDREAR
ncbi:MAG: hypothetical protein ABIT37_11895, partial [Luteolibacter sp.]